jgi:hypothetical protein
VVLREKLMHGLPVRVVAVTNVDLKIMSRRTPTDSVLGRRRSPRASGSENASRYCRSGIARAATTAGAEFGEGIDLVVAVTGFFDRLLMRLMTGGTSWAAEQ